MEQAGQAHFVVFFQTICTLCKRWWYKYSCAVGVIVMFSAILALLAMPFTDLRSRGIQLKPLNKAAFYIFIGNFLILMVLGAKHVESPYIEGVWTN